MGMSDQPVSFAPLPAGYTEWLLELKARIHSAQQRATLAVNRELVVCCIGRSGAIFWRGRPSRAGVPR